MKAQPNDPLVNALEANDASAMEILLDAGRSLMERHYFARTPLHIAAAADASDCVRVLLGRGAPLEAHDEAGNTALMDALQAGHATLASELIAAGARLHYRYQREDTPEIREQLRRSYEEIQAQSRRSLPLIYRVFDALSSKREGEQLQQQLTKSMVDTTLAASEIHAVHHCANLECLKLLGQQPGVSFNIDDGAGYWPLKSFTEAGNATEVEWLLKNGADPNFTSTGDSALHAAVCGNHIECARLLLTAGANPNQQDVDGCVPMWRVASDEMLDLLLAHGADPAIGDQCGFTPSHWAEDAQIKARLLTLERESQSRAPGRDEKRKK